MNTTDLMKLLESAGQKGGSELNMRSEDLQTKQRVSRIPSLKKKLKKKSKILLVLDLAIPFNPETGKEDDQFNSSHKFRPPVSATSAALLAKLYANNNPEAKAVFMKRAGVTTWDTSDTDTFTTEDWTIFSRYRVPRLFTMNVVTVNIPAITKDFARDYAIKVDRDKNTGDVIGKVPVALKINKLFRDKIYEQVSDFTDKCDNGVYNLTEQQQKDRKREMYSSNPVSDDHPANWAEIIELPLTKNFSISADLEADSLDVAKIKELQVNSKYSKKLREKVSAFQAGELEVFDKYFDFYEMDMACPSDGDEQTKEGKMQLGLNTSFDNPAMKLSDDANYQKIVATIREFLDCDVDVEKEMLRSVYVSEYTSDLENQLIKTLPTVLDLDDEFCTNSVITANKDIISLAYGDDGIELIEEADAGVSDRNNGQLDEAASAASQKEYDLTSEEFQDSVDDLSPNLSEVDLES